MATTTVAAGRIRNKANENQPAPPGWLLTKDGLPSTDPLEAVQNGGYLTSLGGSPEGSSYKGYGLSVMVNILSACLSGSTLITDPMHQKQPFGMDIGHFFLALNPTLFRDEGEFEHDVGDSVRRAARHAAGRPGATGHGGRRPGAPHGGRRLQDGIPVGPGLLAKVREIAEASGVPWMLGE